MKFIKALPASRELYLIPCSNPNDPLYLVFPQEAEIYIYEEKGRIFISQIKIFSDNMKHYHSYRSFYLHLEATGPYPELKKHFLISTIRNINAINDQNNHLVEATRENRQSIYFSRGKFTTVVCDLNE